MFRWHAPFSRDRSAAPSGRVPAGRPSRRSRARERLAAEALEPRLALSANVAVGAEAGRDSQPLLRLIDVSTGKVVAETLAFERGFRGGVRVAMGDVDGNGDQEVIAGPGDGRVAEVRVFDIRTNGGRTTLVELPAYRVQPFGAAYTHGVSVACGDIDGNGRDDIVASMSRGRGTVKVFLSVPSRAPANDPLENVPYLTITPAAAGFDGGSAVAVGDVGAFVAGRQVTPGVPDGKMEIVVASGVDAAPKVEVYDVSVRSAPRVVTTIKPFTPNLRWGLTVSTGRVNNDALDDVIVSAGRHAGMRTAIYDGTPGSARLMGEFTQAGPTRPNAPGYAAPVDANGDGRIDTILVAQGDAGGATGLFKTVIANASSTTTVTLPTLPGPLRVAAPRTTFKPQTLPNGIVQQDFIRGTGPSPVATQQVRLRYTGSFADGSVFDTTGERMATAVLSAQASGFLKVVGMMVGTMQEGGVRRYSLPPELAFGKQGQLRLDATGKPLLDADGKPVYIVPPNTPVNFIVELVSVTPAAT